FVLACTIRAVIMMYSPILDDTHTLMYIHVVVICSTIFAPHATWSSLHPKSRKHWRGNTSNILAKQVEFCSLAYTRRHTQQKGTNPLPSLSTPGSTSFFFALCFQPRLEACHIAQGNASTAQFHQSIPLELIEYLGDRFPQRSDHVSQFLVGN